MSENFLFISARQMDMSKRDPSTVKAPAIKRLKVNRYSRTKMKKMVFGLAPSIGDRRDGELRKMVTANNKPLKEKTDKTKVNYSQLENLPNEILLKIFNCMNPKIKELLLFGHVSRRIRWVSHDQSLWQNLNLLPKNPVPTGLLQLILENGCQRINTSGKIVGTLTLNQESQLKFLNTGSTKARALTVLLSSSYSLEQLHLSNVILNHNMISSICYQNGQTLKVLRLVNCNKKLSDDATPSEWIGLIIDNCRELIELDLSDTHLSEESIEYLAKNLTPKNLQLRLTGIKSATKCQQIVEMLKDRCNNLTELKMFEIFRRPGLIYGIGSYINSYQERRKSLRDIISTFRRYE